VGDEFLQFVGRLSDSIVDTVNAAYDWCEPFECYSRHVDYRHHFGTIAYGVGNRPRRRAHSDIYDSFRRCLCPGDRPVRHAVWVVLDRHFCGRHGDGSCQGGLNSLSGKIYPPTIRSTGAGWALGLGRVGGIAGPAIGGALLALGFGARGMFIVAAIPIAIITLLMAILGRLRRNG
jgi:hypothetical protein